MTLRCVTCGRDHPLTDLPWRCARCHGVLDLAGFTAALPDRATLRDRPPALWRYAEALPVDEPPDITMGEGMTPLLSIPGHPSIALKADYLMPTGSFKDRGAALLVALARELNVTRMVADSSGNSGAAIAAYAARAGIACDVYVPAATSAGKLGQLLAYGAIVHRIEGSREDTAAAAAAAADEPGIFYASHVYHPFFPHGTKTYVFELWEQLGGQMPGTLVLPAGNGTLVLGAYLGCRELLEQQLIDRLPVIVAVQAAACAPLARAFIDGLTVPASVTAGATIAEGIAIAAPARGHQVLAAVRGTAGRIVTVTDDQIRAAHKALARAGLYVEPTAAASWAAVSTGAAGIPAAAGPRPHTVVPLCGSGLKSAPG
jgi:threonine synthase